MGMRAIQAVFTREAFHRLDMTLAVAEALNPNKPNKLGKDFELLTDHKPLELIYGPKSRPSARIERWVLRLQPFTFKGKYIPGKMNVADVLSRLSSVTSSPSGNGEVEDYVMSLTQSAVPRTMSSREIEKASKVDSELQVLRQAIASGDFSGCDTAYRAIKDELTTIGYIVLRQSRIIIPEKLRGEVLTLAHQGHQGEVKTKARLREKVWWPGMDRQCETFIKRCHGCQVASLPNRPEPIEATPMPDGPWQDLALDFVGPFPTGEHILVVVDYYSRYFLVKLMRKTTAETLIAAMEESVDLFGIPFSVTTDNGPQFISREFQEYLKTLDIHHRKTTPRWAQANGEVERQNRTLLKAMRVAHAEGKDWRLRVEAFSQSIPYHPTLYNWCESC